MTSLRNKTAIILLCIIAYGETFNSKLINIANQNKLRNNPLSRQQAYPLNSTASTSTTLTPPTTESKTPTTQSTTPQRRRRPRRHPLFSQTNTIIQKSNPPPHTWTAIIPPPTAGISTPGRDVKTIFTDPLIGAQDLLDRCHISSSDALRHLHRCLSLFCDVTAPDATTYRARIVSSRGRVGTKCPRWHVDHVPVRLICALEGPGVCLLEGGSVGGVNESEEVDSGVVNRAIVDAVGEGVMERRCGRGDVVLLMGKEWEEDNEGDCECCDDNGKDVVRAVVHKSPELMPFQGRVLLTVDIAEEVKE